MTRLHNLIVSLKIWKSGDVGDGDYLWLCLTIVQSSEDISVYLCVVISKIKDSFYCISKPHFVL